jgi:Mg-chelatase subunit ChlD
MQAETNGKEIQQGGGFDLEALGLTPTESVASALGLQMYQQGTGERGTVVMLIDRSGSMSSDTDGRGSRINLAWRAMKEQLLPNLEGWSVGLLYFPALHDDEEQAVWTVEPNHQITAAALREPHASGGTPMLRALQTAWEYFKQTQAKGRIILVSDGCPTDSEPEDILDVAQTGIIIDTVGIAPRSDSEEFLKKLAELTGGIYQKVNAPAQLEYVVKALSPKQRPVLGAPKGS